MSASEKLRALESPIYPGRGRDLLAALPQLVAVVAAAEWVSESGVLSFDRYKALSDALAALEEALSDE